jgi:hypothetical protein
MIDYHIAVNRQRKSNVFHRREELRPGSLLKAGVEFWQAMK